MQAENAAARRRFTLLDAIIVVAAIAVAILPAAELWPDVAPVVQRLEVTRIFEPRYVQDELFGGHMRSARNATVRIQMAQMVNLALGLPSRRDRHIDPKARKRAPEQSVQNWVLTHAPPGALGFALAQDAFYLFFPFLLVWSFCLLCLRLIQPRPPWSTLVRQPGSWACVGSIVGVLLDYALDLFIKIPAPSVIVPVTVVLVWIVLAVSRKWQGEPSWIDRAGRALGVLWVAMIPIYLAGFVWD